MKPMIIMLAPGLFAGLSILLWMVYREADWKPRFARWILWCAIIGLAMYVSAYIGSLIGDWMHGPADSFDWSPIYVITLPMMIGGWFLTLAALLTAFIGLIIGIVAGIKQKGSEQAG